MVDDPDPVCVAIKRNTEVRAARTHGGNQICEILDDRWIGVMIGEGAVALAEQIARIEAETAKQATGHEGSSAIPAVEDHAQPPRKCPRACDDVVDVPVDDGGRPNQSL